MANASVCLATTGEGFDRAGKSLSVLLHKFRFRALIGVGLAGGLSPSLREGQVLAVREVRGPGGEVFRPSDDWLARAAPLADGVGVLVSDGTVRWTAEEKAKLLANHPGIENVAIDTESGAWGRSAAKAGVPFLAIRAVFDRATEDLPIYLRAEQKDGSIDRTAIATHALRHPAVIPELFALRRRTRRAMARIADLLVRLLAEPQDSGGI
jgi:adenosylhomocysteine nucleosidase